MRKHFYWDTYGLCGLNLSITFMFISLSTQLLAGANFTQYVNPFIGTDSSNSPSPVPGGSGGSTFPGAAAPFGMIQWSPDTPHGEPSGYKYGDRQIRGFSLTHYNGAGCPNNEELPILPIIGQPSVSPGTAWQDYVANFSHDSEKASPGYYGVTLTNSGIKVELTAAPRSAFGRFTFAADAVGTLLLDVSHHATGATQGDVTIVGNNRIEGSMLGGNFCMSGQTYRIFFAAEFAQDFSSFGTWQGSTLTQGERSTQGVNSGVFVSFAPQGKNQIQMKIAISFVSLAGARANLASDVPHWDFDQAKQSVSELWEKYLSRIQVKGGTWTQLENFYTALYHVFLNPTIASDVSGEYLGFDQQIHIADGYINYQNYSGWDIYRSWVQLMAMISPKETSDVIKSMVAAGQEGGALPKWSQQNTETTVMVGDPGALIVASAYAFGIRDFALDDALALMDKTGSTPSYRVQGKLIRPGLDQLLQFHYVPIEHSQDVWGPAATTLEYTSADFAVAQFAKSLGNDSIYQRYMQRAQYWQELFNPEFGYITPKYKSGSWQTPLIPGSLENFVEGNAAQYTWMVPFNLQSIINLVGGKAAAVQRLDALFSELNGGIERPYFYIGNEPQFATPWAYAFAGAPWRTQSVVRQIMTDWFNEAPGGLPGNDDLGATSSWYIWAALGLYPAIPGTDILLLHGALFPEVTISPPNHPQLVIHSEGAGSAAPFIKNVAFNGTPTTQSWFHYRDIVQGGSLQFTMDSSPNKTWGTSPSDLPPSFLEGMQPIPVAQDLGHNIALGANVTADSSCSIAEGPVNAVDGRLGGNSKWCSHGSQPWLQIDLGHQTKVKTIVVKHAGWGSESTAYNTRDFDLMGSNDGVTYTTLANVRGNIASKTMHPISDNIKSGWRIIKLAIITPTNDRDRAARIYELEVYGEPSTH